MRKQITWLAVLMALSVGAEAGFRPTERPFLWMNRQEVEGAKRRWGEPWAKQAFEVSLSGCDTTTFRNLFKYQVLGDEDAGQAELGKLLGFIGDDITQSKPRSDNVEHVLRYDIFYDRLTPEQREAIEATFREHIRWLLNDYWRGPSDDPNWKGEKPRVEYTRTNWLPNMHYPRNQGIFLMALALQDEALIREVYACRVAGFQWFMGDYVADGRFYMEEFGKQYSTFGELLLWCRGCERLGLDELGFGHVGRNGATMKRYCEGRFMLGLPRPAVTGGLPSYTMVTMGDAGSQHRLLEGATAENPAGALRWTLKHMNGPAPRMMTPLWFELAHRQWPDAHFDYFLAQMRGVGDDRYYPSLFFDLDPVDPSRVSPPPVASFTAPERGFALLRAEEGTGYWTSPKPVVALQFGSYYVHYVHDCFSILEYYAFNRPMVVKRSFGPHAGYAGGHPWRDHGRGHQTVVVDNRQIQPVDTGDEGAAHQHIRHGFSDAVKFVSVHAAPYTSTQVDPGTGERKKRTKALFRDVAMERALFLADEYLLDLFRCVSDRDRLYHWNMHPVGTARPEAPHRWKPTDKFDGGKLWDLESETWASKVKEGGFDLPDVRRCEMGDDDWSFQTLQQSGHGLKLWMLGEKDTAAYYDTTHDVTTLIVERTRPETLFAALHEHFEKAAPSIAAFERIHQDARAVVVRVTGEGYRDHLMFRFTGSDEPVSVSFGNESLGCGDYGYVRVTRTRVVAAGDLTDLRLRVKGASALSVNGVAIEAPVEDGVLTWTRNE